MITAFEVHTGRVFGQTYPRHCQEEFMTFLTKVDAQYPSVVTDIVAICNNLAVHKTARLQE